jgi:hypothetical protein
MSERDPPEGRRIDRVLVVIDAAAGIAADPGDVHEPRLRRGHGIDGAARERDRRPLVRHEDRGLATGERQHERGRREEPRGEAVRAR